MYRHELLEQLLRIIGVKEENIYEDVEGIEHHLSWDAIDRVGDLVQFLKKMTAESEYLGKFSVKMKKNSKNLTAMSQVFSCCNINRGLESHQKMAHRKDSAA